MLEVEKWTRNWRAPRTSLRKSDGKGEKEEWEGRESRNVVVSSLSSAADTINGPSKKIRAAGRGWLVAKAGG